METEIILIVAAAASGAIGAAAVDLYKNLRGAVSPFTSSGTQGVTGEAVFTVEIKRPTGETSKLEVDTKSEQSIRDFLTEVEPVEDGDVVVALEDSGLKSGSAASSS